MKNQLIILFLALIILVPIESNAQFGNFIKNNAAKALNAIKQEKVKESTSAIDSAAQQKAAADIQAQIAAQRLSAGQSLAGLGQGGIGQALGAAGQGVTAAMTPQQLYNQYASVIFGTPAASYTPDFRGTIGSTTNTNQTGYQMGVGGAYGSLAKPF